MHRFFVSKEAFSGNRVAITGPDVKHMRTVLRLKAGDHVAVVDPQGIQYEVRLTELTRDRVEAEVLSHGALKTESPLHILMGQALIKGQGFDFLVRKAAELGVQSITPLKTHRCVAKLIGDKEASRIQRWQGIAGEAAKQCGRSQIPEVHNRVLSLEEFCREAADSDLKLVFWEEETETRLHDISSDSQVSSIAFVAGPEGGLAAEEIDLLRRHGYQTVSLGPRLLKADSVSLVILSLLQHRWGDL